MVEALVLQQARSKVALAILGSIGFAALGVWLIVGPVAESSRYPPEYIHLAGWVTALFFGLGGLVGLGRLVKPTEVILTPEGFQVVGFGAKPLVLWREVERFFILQANRVKLVSWIRKPEAMTAFQRAAALRPSVLEADGSLPTGLVSGPDEVCALLEDWRRRYGGPVAESQL